MIRSKYTIEKYIPPAKTLHERDAMKENCLKAFEHVTNWRVIAYIAVMGSGETREKALAKVTNQNILSYIAMNDISSDIQMDTLERVKNKAVLYFLEENKYGQIKEKAKAKLDPNARRPSDRKIKNIRRINKRKVRKLFTAPKRRKIYLFTFFIFLSILAIFIFIFPDFFQFIPDTITGTYTQQNETGNAQWFMWLMENLWMPLFIVAIPGIFTMVLNYIKSKN